MTGLSAIITVGNEILDGIVLDRNSQWITNRMKPLGLMVNERFTVRDDINEIVKAITRSIDDGCKLIIQRVGV